MCFRKSRKVPKGRCVSGDKSLAVLDLWPSFEIFSYPVGLKIKRKLFESMNKQQTQFLELIPLGGNLIYTYQALHYVRGNSEGEMLEGLQQPQFL